MGVAVITRMSAGEQGCSYAAMILHDDGIAITEDKISALLKAANVECESYWPGLFVRALNGQDLDKVICTPALGGGGGGAPGAAAPAAAGGEAAAAGGDAKKESSDEEEEIPAAGGLFDEGDDY